jgi:hypothetical protein
MLNNYNYFFIREDDFLSLKQKSCDPPFCKNIMKERRIKNNKFSNYSFGTLPKLDKNVVSNTYRSNNQGRINANGFLWRRPKIQIYNLPKSIL